jgi:phosphate transport system substrate-binding protein
LTHPPDPNQHSPKIDPRSLSLPEQPPSPRIAPTILSALLLLLAIGCGPADQTRPGIAGNVRVDGSSTVFPISEAVAEEFGAAWPTVRVAVGKSGTGGGFKKFVLGETDINDASRPITENEIRDAAAHGIQFLELPIAYDGISIVVNPRNNWVDHLTLEELRAIWQPGSTVTNWSDVRPNWPPRPIRLYGAGHDSGTFDYFTEAVMGTSRACRSDFTASEDDNTLVMGVAGETDALGFFGFAYYIENTDKLRAVPIDAGKGPIAPTVETIRNATYAPLSRPVFLYISSRALERPEVVRFVEFYLDNVPELAAEVGYVPFPPAIYEIVARRFTTRTMGTLYTGAGHSAHLTLEELLAGQ